MDTHTKRDSTTQKARERERQAKTERERKGATHVRSSIIVKKNFILKNARTSINYIAWSGRRSQSGSYKNGLALTSTAGRATGRCADRKLDNGREEKGEEERGRGVFWGWASCKLWLDLLAPFAIITTIQRRRRQVNRVSHAAAPHTHTHTDTLRVIMLWIPRSSLGRKRTRTSQWRS